MRCPKCKSDDFLTTDSRDYFNNRIRRRKKCVCGHTWSTLEYVENERTKKNKPARRCQYLGCARSTFGKGNNTKYCPEHKRQWENLRWDLWRAKRNNTTAPVVPTQFNRR